MTQPVATVAKSNNNPVPNHNNLTLILAGPFISAVTKTNLPQPPQDLDHEVGAQFHPHCCSRCVPPTPSGLSTPLHPTRPVQPQPPSVHSTSRTNAFQTLKPCSWCPNNHPGRPLRRRGAASSSCGGSAVTGRGPSACACWSPALRPRPKCPHSGRDPGRGPGPRGAVIPTEEAPNWAILGAQHGGGRFARRPVPLRWGYAGRVRSHYPSRFYPSVVSSSAKWSSFRDGQMVSSSVFSVSVAVTASKGEIIRNKRWTTAF